MPDLQPDLSKAQRHVEMVTGSPAAAVDVRLIHDRDRQRDARRLHGSLKELWPQIEAAQRDGFGAYVVVNEGGNSAADITRIRAVFVDADDVPLPDDWHAKPDLIVLRDATHWHAYWRVHDLPVDQFREVQHGLAARYGTDRSVCDASRVMRLAGSLHLKGEPRSVDLLDLTDGALGFALGRAAHDLTMGLPPAPERTLTPSPVAGEAISADELSAALSFLNPDEPRDAWLRHIAGIRAAPIPVDDDGVRLDLALRWSRGELDHLGRYKAGPPPRYTSDEDVEQAFDTMPPKAGGVTVGTVLADARAAGFSGACATFGMLASATVKSAAGTPPDPVPVDEWAARVQTFRAREPDEDAALPELEYWDEGKTLPKQPGGCAGVAFGPSGVGKTTVLLADLLNGIRDRSARVLYCAGEGAHGLGKQRLPAECDARGIKPRDLRGQWRLVWRAPNLLDRQDVEALVEAHRDFRPDIVVIDTLSTAIPGADEDAAATASAVMSGNGSARRIARAWNATVIVAHHTGKDPGRGARGSSGWEGNSDFALVIKSNKAAGTAELHVKKMRDGPDGFSVFYRVNRSPRGVPLARRVPEGDFRAAVAAESANPQREVYRALQRLCRASGGPVTSFVLASETVPLVEGQRPEDRERLIHNEIKRLQSLARPNKRNGKAGPLAPYVVRDHRGEPLSPIMWEFPHSIDDGGDDV